MKAQGATEYIVIVSVVLMIALVCVAILVWPTGSSKDVKQSQSDIKLGIGKIAYPELSQNLITYYKFDEGVGNIAYNSAGQNFADATLLNGTGWTGGIRGKALSLDGIDDVALVQDNSQLRLESGGTISVWINTNQTTSGWIVGTNYNQYGGSGYTVKLGSNSQVQFQIRDSSTTTSTTGVINAGTWNHIAITFVSGNRRIYVNGADVTYDFPSATAMPLVDAVNNSIGLAKDGALPFNGTIDDLHIYNRVLPPQEIELLYKNPGYP